MNGVGAALLITLLAVNAAAEPRAVEIRVVNGVVDGKTWITLSGTIEATTDLGVDQLLPVITDWAAYPWLFHTVKKVEVASDGDAVLLSQTNVVSVLGFPVTNQFTVRLVTSRPTSGPVTVRWTQEHTDGTIDRIEGGWDLEPVTFEGKPGTLVRYRTVSSVPQVLPGQDAFVALFLPGELKQVVASVLAEARRNKEKP